MSEAVFPPLFTGQLVDAVIDPFDKARAEAVRGCESGLVVYNLPVDVLRAAVVLTPEMPLADAVVAMPVFGVGFQNALGALAPPEVAVHLEWDGGILVNGASCGRLRMAAADAAPDAVPDWLIVGLELPLMDLGPDGGETPDRTSLHAEGCAEVDSVHLLESWIRHSLVWINRWQDEGTAPVHREWRGLAQGLGEPVQRNGLDGTFLGIDERFGMLLRDAETTHLIPLTDILETGA